MRKPLLFTVITALGFSMALSSCKSGDDGTRWGVYGDVPKQVTELTTESDYGRITLSWKVPDDEAYYYAKVGYYNPLNGKNETRDVSVFAADEDGYCTMNVDGFIDTEEQNFSVTSYSFGHKHSEPVTTTGNALEPPIFQVKSSVEVEPDVMGALVSWENSSGIPVIVAITYNLRPEAGGEQRTVKYTSATDKTVRVPNMNKDNPGLSINVLDAGEVLSAGETQYPDIEPLAETELKSDSQNNVLGWTVVSEGPLLGGDLGGLALLDGRSTGGVLHTAAPAPFPFDIVYDMQRPTVISKLGVFRRNDDTSNPPSSVSVAFSADNVNWSSVAAIPFQNIAEWQYIYPNQDIPAARYMKFTIPAAANGAHAGLGELRFSGAVEQ